MEEEPLQTDRETNKTALINNIQVNHKYIMIGTDAEDFEQ